MLKRAIPLTVLGLVLFVTERSFGLTEPPAAPRIERLFQRCDANHDGVIDAKEFEEAVKLLAQERARPPREGRPQARPGPRPGDEPPPRPADVGPPPAPPSGPGEDLDPRIIEAVHEVLKRMMPEMQKRMGQKLQEREGRMRGEFREGFERAMREREERAPQFVRRIVEDVWNEHRGEIQRMIDESVQRAMHEGPGRPGMGQPGGRSGMGHPGMQQPGMRHRGMGAPGMGRPGMDHPGMGRPPMPPGGEFDREYPPPPPPDGPGHQPPPREEGPPPQLGEFGAPPGDEFGRDYPPPPPRRHRGMRQFRSDAPPPPRGMRGQRFDEPSPPARRQGAWRQDRPQKREAMLGRWAKMRWLRDRAPWAELRDKVGQNLRPGFWRQGPQREFAGGQPGRAKMMNPNRIAKFRRMVAARMQRWLSGFEQDRGGFMRDGFRGRPRNFDRFDRDGNGRPGRCESMRAGPRMRSDMPPGGPQRGPARRQRGMRQMSSDASNADELPTLALIEMY